LVGKRRRPRVARAGGEGRMRQDVAHGPSASRGTPRFLFTHNNPGDRFAPTVQIAGMHNFDLRIHQLVNLWLGRRRVLMKRRYFLKFF
jgi:hypothetical protein